MRLANCRRNENESKSYAACRGRTDWNGDCQTCLWYGSAMMMEEVGKVIAEGGSGIMISSQSGFRMPALNYGALKPEK
jgi:hypothetical protein